MQQVWGAVGISLVGVVFFSRLGGVGSYSHAFTVATCLEVALLALAAVLSLLLPRRISAEAYKPHRGEKLNPYRCSGGGPTRRRSPKT